MLFESDCFWQPYYAPPCVAMTLMEHLNQRMHSTSNLQLAEGFHPHDAPGRFNSVSDSQFVQQWLDDEGRISSFHEQVVPNASSEASAGLVLS